MPDTRRTHLQVLPLEDRTVPALVIDLNGAGALTAVREAASGQSDAVTLSVLPGNRMTVMEGASVIDTYTVAKNLHIDLGTHSMFLVNRLRLNDNLLKTNLRVDLHGTQTQLEILGGTTGLATIDGNIRVQCGDENQFFLFGEFGEATPHITNVTGSLKIDMGAATNGGFEPVGTVGEPPAPSFANVAGNVTVLNSNVFVWAGRIGGNLTVDSSKPDNQLVFLGNYNRPMTIGGNVSIRTGLGFDHVAFQSTLVGGNTAVNTGGGNDTLQLAIGENEDDNAGFNDVPATFVGKLSVNLGSGNDTAYFGADSLTHPGQTNALTVGGNLIVNAGGGDDNLIFPDARVHGRSISIDGGDGNDEVSIAGLIAPDAVLSAALGLGDDTFGFHDDAAVTLNRAVIDGGTGNDAYEPGTGNDFDFALDRISI
jgi:hypothetical protein